MLCIKYPFFQTLVELCDVFPWNCFPFLGSDEGERLFYHVQGLQSVAGRKPNLGLARNWDKCKFAFYYPPCILYRTLRIVQKTVVKVPARNSIGWIFLGRTEGVLWLCGEVTGLQTHRIWKLKEVDATWPYVFGRQQCMWFTLHFFPWGPLCLFQRKNKQIQCHMH